MDQQPKRSVSESLWRFVKITFVSLLILSFVPSVITGLKTSFDDAVSTKSHVGLISVQGMISDASVYTKQIEAFRKSDDVKGLILRINSPGGYSGSSEVVYRELLKFSKAKPVVAVIENVGASGAYYIAAAAHTIIASPMALVGSIGAVMELANIQRLLERFDVSVKYVQAGKFKTTGSMVKELTPEELAYLQRLSDDLYIHFMQDIAVARELKPEEHTQWADGQIFTGHQALKLGLIDALGSMSDGIDALKKLAKVDGEIKMVHIKRQSGLMKMVLGDYDDDDGIDLATPIAGFMQRVGQKLTQTSLISST